MGLLAVLTLVVFLPHARGYFFLFDDFSVIHAAATFPAERLLLEGVAGFYRPIALLWFRLLYTLFGRDHPAGFASVGLALHVLNSGLVVLFLRRLGGSMRATLAGAAVFLVSPWAGETLFWVSAQPDLLCAGGVTTALLAAFRALEARTMQSCTGWAALAALLALFALFAKEMAVTIPVVFVVLVLASGPVSRPWDRRALCLAAAFAGCVVAYAAMRQRALGAFETPYGNFFDLARMHAAPMNLAGFVRTTLWVPFDGIARSGGRALHGLYVLAVAVLAFAALRAAPRRTLLLALGFLVTLLPVVWTTASSAATSGGRYLYLPGLFVVAALACGFDGLERAMPRLGGRGPVVTASLLAPLVGLGLLTLAWQRDMWLAASRVSRAAILAFEPYVASRRSVYIPNLPLQFVQGPYILKDYAFQYYYGLDGRTVPPVRARSLFLSYQGGTIRVARVVEDRAPAADDQVLVLSPPGAGGAVPPGPPR
jgi:hypothetical protein